MQKMMGNRPHLDPDSNQSGKGEHLPGDVMILLVMSVNFFNVIVML